MSGTAGAWVSFWVMTGGNRPELMSNPQTLKPHTQSLSKDGQQIRKHTHTHKKLDKNQDNEETTRKKLTNRSCIQ
jgi:hypothetical protein